MGRAFVDYEPIVRLGAFAGVLAVMALWEMAAPRRALSLERRSRWPGNIGIVVVDTLLVRILFPTATIGIAMLCEANGWGLFNLVRLPFLVSVVASLLLLDLAIYAQHVLFHAVPMLWRLHRMHHADLDIDVTTGIRFHPLEIILSLLIKFAVVTALGAPPIAVLIFEVLLNATSMFSHANVRLPHWLDRIVRLLVVTPDMHRVHHSILRAETDSNFGFNFPWWDRMFGTYRAEPEAGHDRMTIGIEDFRHVAELRLDRMLLQPFRSLSPPKRRPR
jgi:sterol desaturase/sphingolipid hydroxylase (fatty acid hydroxylase superfamily)